VTAPTSGRRLSVHCAQTPDSGVLVVRGEIDLTTAPGLIAAFTAAAGRDRPLTVDLSDAEVGDQAGTALVLNAVRRLRRCREDLVVVAPPGPVRSALCRTGVSRRLRLMDGVDPAGFEEPANDGPGSGGAGPAVVGGHRQRPSTPVRRAALLAEATLAIELRHADPALGLDDVAREIATSSRQLQRVFAEFAGSSFRDDLAAVRMQHGAALLQGTSLPVAEIARRVGYRQAAQFAKAFRRHHGVAPSAFRRSRPG
jgi:AraC family transcriptional regulator, regulatory protein of adaptative response / methylphosphotriester-DNA alkyltransferase methyltransferase